MPNEINYQYTAMSGATAVAFVNGIQLGTLQAISFTSQREAAFAYVMGNMDPVAVSKGKRGAGGTMVFLEFYGQNALKQIMKDKFILESKWDATIMSKLINRTERTVAEPTELSPVYQTLKDGVTFSGLVGEKAQYEITRPDQIPSFNIIIVNAGEQGYVSRRYILGCNIVNTGSSVSVDEINVSTSFTYIAQAITEWEDIKIDGSAFSGDVPESWISQYSVSR